MNWKSTLMAAATAIACALGTARLQAQIFYDTLPIPPLAIGTDFIVRPHDGVHTYSTSPNAHLTNVPSMGYDVTANGITHPMSNLGPTMQWRKGDSVHIEVVNDLMDMMDTTTVHWHGLHIPAQWDGGPENPIPPMGGTWYPRFLELNESSSLWYHPHLHMMTFKQVSLGLAGMIRIIDPNEPLDTILPYHYGIDDLPIIIQDKFFGYNAMLGTDTVSTYVHVTDTNTVSTSGFDPNTFVVNATWNPAGKLPRQVVRLRMLSGARTVSFNLVVTKGADSTTQRVPFYIVTSDNGYLDSAYQRTNVFINPGERWEILLDLTQFNVGDSITLWTAAADLPGAIDGGGPAASFKPLSGLNIRLARFLIIPTTTATLPKMTFPMALVPLHQYTGHVQRTRTKILSGDFPHMPMIDYTPFHPEVINDIVMLDSTEKWTITNISNEGHPFHIHDVFFTITDTAGHAINAGIYKGPKDVVIVPAFSSITFITDFPDFADSVHKYMYHCHILAHEDQGMMHQFIVWDANWGPVAGVTPDDAGIAPWTVYPNPTDGHLWLRGSSTKPSQVRILDLQGRVLRQLALRPFEGDVEVDVNGLAKGMYFVSWETAKGQGSKKVILR